MTKRERWVVKKAKELIADLCRKDPEYAQKFQIEPAVVPSYLRAHTIDVLSNIVDVLDDDPDVEEVCENPESE